MEKYVKNLSLKIDPELLKKFRYVARYDDRSMNWYMNKMICNCVAKFEAKHGKIKFDGEESAES
ncbi:MAG: ribbon-helix-helix domain-containing protein [Oscillospiraceae bacterium]|jgi:predicted HicB family RNase H-like nuclease|nr:ribbon-helix-helix domain-containing protein [Oscillospiraceae bacterium]